MKIILTHEQRTQLIEELTRGETEIEIVSPGVSVIDDSDNYRNMFMEMADFVKRNKGMFKGLPMAIAVSHALARNAEAGLFENLTFDELIQSLGNADFRAKLRTVGKKTPAVLAGLLEFDDIKRIVEKYTG